MINALYMLHTNNRTTQNCNASAGTHYAGRPTPKKIAASPQHGTSTAQQPNIINTPHPTLQAIQNSAGIEVSAFTCYQHLLRA
jgi:hypothetical protein